MKINLLKWLFIIPSLLLIDWMLIILLGCFSSFCGVSEKLSCTLFCYSGITLLLLTLGLIILLLYKSIKQRIP